MKALTTFALLGTICLAPSMGNAMCGTNTCNTCAPVCEPCPTTVCTQPVCQVQTCTCCPVVRGFLDGGNRGAWGSYCAY